MAGTRTQRGRDADVHGAPDVHSAKGASPWEWVVAAIGLVVLVAAIGYLGYFELSNPAGPPVLSIEQGAVERSGDGYVMAIAITNSGASTAASVTVEGTLRRDGTAVETSTATFDYVPRFSERTGGLLFATDPRDGRLELRAKGYVEP